MKRRRFAIALLKEGGCIALEQRTIFRQGNHISPYFTITIFNMLNQILAISLDLLGKNYLDFIGIKARYVFLYKIKKLQEIYS